MEKDLFECLEIIDNDKLHAIIERFSEIEHSYNTCSELVSELEKIGYTCQYGLDAIPYDLKKIN